jgi:hypothetical protein
MASRQGKIALQLTQWVGGTIIILMFIFILVDYAVQASYFHEYQGDIAKRGADGLKIFLERAVPFEDTMAELTGARDLLDYVESQDRNFVVFDDNGTVLIKTPGAIGSEPDSTGQLTQPRPSGTIELRRIKVQNAPAVAAVASFESRGDAPQAGILAYIVLVEHQQQMALKMWGIRTTVVFGMIIATMLAVRIPVRRFVVAPIDGLFMAAYAASKDDFQRLPACPVDNEFAELYEMFNRLMGHLSDTRVSEALGEKPEGGAPPEEPVE